MNAAKAGGRRAATPRRFRGDRTAALAVGLLLLAAVAVVATRNPPPADLTATSAGSVVDRTFLACPDDDEPRLRSRTDVGLAPVRGPAGDVGDEGSLKAGAAMDGTRVKLRRGAVRTVAGSPAPVLDATGEVAAGLFGFRADDLDRGTAVGSCTQPRGEWWFSGAGAGLDHLSELVLTNVDPGPAVVDIEILGEDGPIETVGTRGVTIAPGETSRLALADAAPQNDEVVVHVEASRGRVSAAVTDRYAPRPAGAKGLEWLTGVEQPDRRLLLAGLPAKATERTLLVGNPSDLEALVDVQVSGSRGSFVPAGFETVSVPPGSVRAVDVTDLLTGDEATSVRLRSQVPVVGAVRSVQGDDASYAGAVLPLGDPAAAPVLEGSRTTVQLTAGPGGARARVTGYSRSGEATGKDVVRVDPAATTTWQPAKGTTYVVVTPVEGRVYGAATYAGAAGIAAAPLVSMAVRLDLPAVVPAPR